MQSEVQCLAYASHFHRLYHALWSELFGSFTMYDKKCDKTTSLLF